MTPQERDLVSGLFNRLAALETAPRDPQAEAAIRDDLQRAPHAVYALVQTVLVQDEALKRADARIRELGGLRPKTSRASAAFSTRCATRCSAARPSAAARCRRSRRREPIGASAASSRSQSVMDRRRSPPEAYRAGRLVPRHGGCGCGWRDRRQPPAQRHPLDVRRQPVRPFRGNFDQGNRLGGLNSPWGNAGGNDLAQQAGIDDIRPRWQAISMPDKATTPACSRISVGRVRLRRWLRDGGGDAA